MARLRRLLRIAGGVLAFLLYVWFAAVRNAGRAKRHKKARRQARNAAALAAAADMRGGSQQRSHR